MICRCRGRTRSKSSTDQLSSASGNSVWLVYRQVSTVICQASSQAMLWRSTRIRISSAITMLGWVSLSWMAARSERVKRAVGPAVPLDEVLQRGADEEILLTQTQLPPRGGLVARI